MRFWLGVLVGWWVGSLTGVVAVAVMVFATKRKGGAR